MTIRIDRVEVTTASETGATHRQRGQGCDDAVGWSGPSGSSVLATVALADGHSDERCVRSQAGAAFVVAAATALPGDTNGPGAIANSLIADWRHRVDLDLTYNPLGPAGVTSDADARLAYGTTAVACRITSDAISIVRIGDGDVIAVAADGAARRLAVPEQQRGELTESISAPDAERLARSAEVSAGAAPVLLVLATDGFDNAYPSADSMLRAAGELAQLRRDSGQPIAPDVLNRWAREAADVSGDDATVAVIWIETSGA